MLCFHYLQYLFLLKAPQQMCHRSRCSFGARLIAVWSCDSVFRVITKLWAKRQDIILYSINVQTGPGGLPSLLYRGYRVSFLGVGRPEREFDYSPPPVAQVRNKRSFTSACPVRFRDVYWNSYIFWLFALFIVLGLRQE